MARPSKYTDEDKALVHTALTAHEGNVKRVSRETGVPEQTVRNWKKTWVRKGLPAQVAEAVPALVDATVDRMVNVRDKALDVLEDKLDAGDVKAGELNAVIGTLTDKIRLLKGEATSRTETVQKLPSTEELGAALQHALEQSFLAGQAREVDIVDAEFTEEQVPAGELPAAS